jgi:hypothetical protein
MLVLLAIDIRVLHIDEEEELLLELTRDYVKYHGCK